MFGARIVMGTLAILIWIGLAVALRTSKMCNFAWLLQKTVSRHERPVYYWFNFALAAGLSAFCGYLVIWAPP
jgi:hypothetical protein